MTDLKAYSIESAHLLGVWVATSEKDAVRQMCEEIGADSDDYS
jgi:hypothetical protein